MFYTTHKCEWCERVKEPTLCIETPSPEAGIQYSYLCLWCITDEYNRVFVLKENPLFPIK